MKKIIYALLCVTLLSSCLATHDGYMANSASLSSNNFSYVRKGLMGSSTATYIFGCGGLSVEAMVSEAKDNMLMDNPLKDNQAIANVTVSFKNSSYLGAVYGTKTCTVTCDIVEFNK